MLRRRKITLIAFVGIAAAFVVLTIGGRYALQSFFYPKPSVLPPIVGQTIEELLAHLQLVLERRAPGVARSLQAGLSDGQISTLEAQGGFHLSDDLKALYRWRNGLAPGGFSELIPGQRFVPLDEVVRERVALRGQVKSGSSSQRAAYALFAGYRNDWLMILTDGAGDGYFFDSKRSEKEGPFFYHFAEGGYYIWFPSVRNFLSGVIDCYEARAVRFTDDLHQLEEDTDQTQKIWNRLGASSEGGR